ncbi:MAG: DUF2304 domain-containing protein [Candidatus Delongbacteria bacterium]|jgi:hypothetical protein|nr:DUF2304 domain-containing protein [Candidatus Delongbacteria bacterium]
MLQNINTDRVEYFAMAGSILLLVFIIELIRRKKIKEQYSLLWLFFSAGFILLSFWRDGIEEIAALMGIAYAPAAFLLILVMAIFLILIQFSIIISKLSETNKTLVQEIGLLKEKMRVYNNNLKK